MQYPFPHSTYIVTSVIDRLGMNAGMCISLHLSLFFSLSMSLHLFHALVLFLSYSLKTIFVGTLCLNLIVLIPAEHPLNKYFGQRKGIEPAILCVSISYLVSPYRMGNCVCVLLHFKVTAFHLMGRIIHRRRNRLQAKVRVMAEWQKAH